MSKSNNYDYYQSFLKETNEIVLEQDQSTKVGEIVRETESHQSDLIEKELRVMTENHQSDLTEGELRIMSRADEDALDEGFTTEDKIILAQEEEYPPARELTPGEIDKIINKALNGLSSMHEVAYEVAYEIMHKMLDTEE